MYVSLPEVLYWFHVCFITNMNSIRVITIFLLKCWTETNLITNGKADIDCYFDVSIHCTTQLASLLLCFTCWGGCYWRGCQGWEAFEKISFHYLYTFCLCTIADCTTLCSIVQDSDDDGNPPSPSNSFPSVYS